MAQGELRGMAPGQLLVDSGQPRRFAGYRTDVITTLLTVWFTFGLMLDAWAHNNIPGLESFFTPWHAVFYSGFAATGGWILWTLWRGVREGRTGMAAIPVGYGPAVIGLPVFAVFAAGDLVWHAVLGVEQDLKILFSPTHLALVAAMGMILTSPLRSALADRSIPAAPTLRRLLPAVLSLSFTAALVLLFLQYGNAMTYDAAHVVQAFSVAPGEGDTGPDAGRLAASIVITSLVLIVPLLMLARRWRLPVGTATILHTAVGTLAAAVTGFENVSTILGLIAAGVLADLLILVMRPGPARPVAYRAFAGLVPLVTWALHFGIAAGVVGQLPNVPELWTGAPIVAALLGMIMATLLNPVEVDTERGSAVPGATEPARTGSSLTNAR